MKKIIFILILWNTAIAQKSRLPEWAFGGFTRPENVNPIIAPNRESVFLDPITQDSIKWESNDAFNPAATIKD